MFEDMGKALVALGVLCAIGGAVVWNVLSWLFSHISIGWTP